MAILKVYDSNGNKINIPAIKGQSGVEHYEKRSGTKYDLSFILDECLQISCGRITVMGENPVVLAELGDGRCIYVCNVDIPGEYSYYNPFFHVGNLATYTRTVEFVPHLEAAYRILNTQAEVGNYHISRILLTYISSVPDAPEGDLHYCVVGRCAP